MDMTPTAPAGSFGKPAQVTHACFESVELSQSVCVPKDEFVFVTVKESAPKKEAACAKHLCVDSNKQGSLNMADNVAEVFVILVCTAMFGMGGYTATMVGFGIAPFVFSLGGAGVMLGVAVNKTFYLATDKTVGEAIYDVTH